MKPAIVSESSHATLALRNSGVEWVRFRAALPFGCKRFPTKRNESMPVSARPVVNRTFASPALLLAATLLLAGGCKSSAPTESVNPKNVPAAAPQINGQDVVTLQRKATEGGKTPEFLSATVIPGPRHESLPDHRGPAGQGHDEHLLRALARVKRRASSPARTPTSSATHLSVLAARSWCPIRIAFAASFPMTSRASSPPGTATR